MDRDISFLSDVQQDVFGTLCSLFPNFSNDALIDALTSEVNYSHEMENATHLLNRCMDDLANREPVVDLTGMFPPDPSFITLMPKDEVIGSSVNISQPPDTKATVSKPPETNVAISQPPETKATISLMPKDEGTSSMAISQPPKTNLSISSIPKDEGTRSSVTISQPPETNFTISPMRKHEGTRSVAISQPPKTNVTISSIPKDEGTGSSVTISKPPETNLTISLTAKFDQDEIIDIPNHKIDRGTTKDCEMIDEDNNVIVELEDSEEVVEVVVVPDGSDSSSSSEVIVVVDDDSTSDFEKNETVGVESLVREVKLSHNDIVLQVREDPMKRNDMDDTSLSNNSNIFSSKPSCLSKFDIAPVDPQVPVAGVTSGMRYTSDSKYAGLHPTFKPHNSTVYTSHGSKSFNSAVFVNDSKSMFSPKSSLITNQTLSHSSNVAGPSTSVPAFGKSLLAPILAHAARNLSYSQSILRNDREKTKLIKGNISQQGMTCVSNGSQALTSGKQSVVHDLPERLREHRTVVERPESSLPIISHSSTSSTFPLSSQHVIKDDASSFKLPFCRVHRGVTRCNCKSDMHGKVTHSSAGHQSALAGSSQTHGNLSQFKQSDHKVGMRKVEASYSHHRSKGKRSLVTGRYNGAVSIAQAHVHEMNRSPLIVKGMSYTTTGSSSTNVLLGFAHFSKDTPSISNGINPASLDDPRSQNDLNAAPHKMVVLSKSAKLSMPEVTLQEIKLPKSVPRVPSISAIPQSVFGKHPSRVDVPGTSNVLPTCQFKPQVLYTNSSLQRVETHIGINQTLSSVPTVKVLLDSKKKSGTSINPENSVFVPRNIALAQGSTSHASNVIFPGLLNGANDIFPGLLNGRFGGMEEVKGTNSTTTVCATCQRIGGECSCLFPGAGTVPETVKEDLTGMVARVINLFPDASLDFVRQKLETTAQSYPDPVQWLCNLMIEEAYPKKPPITIPKPVTEDKGKSKANKNYLTEWRDLPRNWMDDRAYFKQTREVLASVYNLISMASIDSVMKATNYRLSPALFVFDQVVESKEFKGAEISLQMSRCLPISAFSLNLDLPGERKGLTNGNKKESRAFRIKLNKTRRTFKPPVTHEMVLQEINDYKCYQEGRQLESDHQLALDINQKEYDQNQQGIQCECCFTEYPFENMVQCFEMHLFCTDCLQHYVNEAIYGHGKENLACMATDCSSTFPRDQLEKSLVPDVLAKYDERCSEESVHKADLEDLVRCPHCDYAAILASELKAFLCLQCCRETCRDCKVDWVEHFGKKCTEVEKDKSEEEIRTKYEEKLTEALIRACPRCKASIVKENGCNKMTCRCGAKMCYICRKPNIDYNHFCQHVRDPKIKGCNKCNSCCLWEVAEAVDERNMTGIKVELKKEQDEKGIDSNKRAVGVPDHISAGPSKKPRIL